MGGQKNNWNPRAFANGCIIPSPILSSACNRCVKGCWVDQADLADCRRLPAHQTAGNRQAYEEPAIKASRWWLLRIFFGNSSLLIGGLLVLGLLYLTVYGRHLTNANPYQIHGVMTINGMIGAPPFPPSSVFPWGRTISGATCSPWCWREHSKPLPWLSLECWHASW